MTILRRHWNARTAAALVAALVTLGWGGARRLPHVFVVGDSTVKNGSGRGEGGLWGWGDFLAEHLDLDEVVVENDALGGRSSRTFQTEGLWAAVLTKVQAGDYVLMQFGHNDGIRPDDPRRPRGSLRGTGEETVEIINPQTHEPETVYTYGHYMRTYIRDTKAKGATPIVVTPIPRDIWDLDGHVVRDDLGYPLWARQVAEEEGARVIDLHEIIARRYDAEGPSAVRAKYFVEDHTHTTEAGARLNASAVAEAIRAMTDLPLASMVLPADTSGGRTR